MLVLSRKTTERIHIGDNITVEVRRVAGNRVTLAIEAPRDISILRGELEQAARDFEEKPEPEEAATNQPADTYIVSHKRVPLADALPPSDLSDHGMTAYAI